MNPYTFGSFFPALAAGIRIKIKNPACETASVLGYFVSFHLFPHEKFMEREIHGIGFVIYFQHFYLLHLLCSLK
ncbi:MAG: hypothetical protein ACK559_37980, partial [bacterium]